MADNRCPGQDQRNWQPEDIMEVPCPRCRALVEIWKDEPVRLCPQCQTPVRNPRLNPGCAKWCSKAAECLGKPMPNDK